MSAIAQLPLAVQLPDDETFATFVRGANQELIQVLQQLPDGLTYLWGAEGVGKTHLLHALCANTEEAVMYVPLAELHDQVQPQILQGLEHYSLICLDDIDAISANENWCFELFALLNRVKDAGRGCIVITAKHAPSHLQVAIADVHSRLQWGLSMHVHALTDEDKARALQVRAKALGLHLADDAAQFMVQRLGRNMRSLLVCLARLDRASIAAKRRLTIPFIKDVLAI
ncbi:regulatory inactivation of DnaA Hda protein [Pseudidiomarina maritima]|uniref:Regulatory inactivation of DnaA Hda protein n=1 Tax=Pseudidiomarina maritima TaxID=519453 RepID=A0A1I6G8C9_9GAMM|nr:MULTISPECIES: DnaA regulatory inactivator Hda [Pseudidiomarina]SFR38400.1 regulatory inactivation of DnaA Hda protein [Pseudidiomarina maritima]